eukprot:53323-Eustigmatos_ZCMA.PRE.1
MGRHLSCARLLSFEIGAVKGLYGGVSVELTVAVYCRRIRQSLSSWTLIMSESSGGEHSPPRKKHQVQPKINDIFAKMSGLRKKAAEECEGNATGRAGQPAA